MLVVMSVSLKSIVMRNMTGSATRFTVGVQGRSLSLNGLCGPCLDADVHVPSYRGVGVGGVFSSMCVSGCFVWCFWMGWVFVLACYKRCPIEVLDTWIAGLLLQTSSIRV